MKNTERFGVRVAEYASFRPSYAEDFFPHITNATMGLRPGVHRLLDCGAGTGIFTRKLLEIGFDVLAVEPNAPMLEQLKTDLSDYAATGKLQTVLGSSSEMPLVPSKSVDFVFCAQAFHWMDPDSTKREFLRVLRPTPLPHQVCLIWNSFQKSPKPLSKHYVEIIAKYNVDYEKVNHGRITNEPHTILKKFYTSMAILNFDTYSQHFDFKSLLGRLKSSSYMPQKEDPLWAEIEADLKRRFDGVEKDEQGRGELHYITEAFLGRLE